MEKTIEFKIPDGYIFDKDNSTENIIRFKPIKKKITYKDIINNIKAKNIGVSVQWGLTKIGTDCFITSEKQLEQLLALNKLMNVAKYLNGNWKPNWNNYNTTKWFIFFDHDKKEIQTRSWYIINPGCVYFKSEELALQAIEILGEKEIKVTLGIFE